MAQIDIEARTKRLIADFGAAERLFYLFCVDPRSAFRGEAEANDHVPGNAAGNWTLHDALDPLRAQFDNFDDMIQGKRVLDYGCGGGYQAVAMADAGAAEVIGVDICDRYIAFARRLAGARPNVSFGRELPRDVDIVISLNAFEHFPEPEHSVVEMRTALRPGGRILITFSPPWLSPWGGHHYFFCRLPWAHLIFSERTVHRVRRLYREDDAMSYEPGLNRMTLARFQNVLAKTGPWRSTIRLTPVKRLKPLLRLSATREYFCSMVTCILDHCS